MYITEEDKNRDRKFIGNLFDLGEEDDSVYILIDIVKGYDSYPYVFYSIKDNTIEKYRTLCVFYPYI